MNNQYTYLSCKNGSWGSGYDSDTSIFVACNNDVGFIIQRDGSIYDSKLKGSSYWNLKEATRNWLQPNNPQAYLSTLRECLKLIDKNKYRSNYNNIFKVLGIKNPDDKPIEITEELKNRVIRILTEQKAFNGDSACPMVGIGFTEFDALDAMEEKGLIKSVYGTANGRYYYLDLDETNH